MAIPKKTVIKSLIKGRDELLLEVVLDDDLIQSSHLTGIGCTPLLKLITQWRPYLTGNINGVPLPEGSHHSSLLLKEVLLKAKNAWALPYQDEELCHCRAVPTEVVKQAIIAGSHTVESVARETSAGTACGSCRQDTKGIISYIVSKG